MSCLPSFDIRRLQFFFRCACTFSSSYPCHIDSTTGKCRSETNQAEKVVVCKQPIERQVGGTAKYIYKKEIAHNEWNEMRFGGSKIYYRQENINFKPITSKAILPMAIFRKTEIIYWHFQSGIGNNKKTTKHRAQRALNMENSR